MKADELRRPSSGLKLSNWLISPRDSLASLLWTIWSNFSPLSSVFSVCLDSKLWKAFERFHWECRRGTLECLREISMRMTECSVFSSRPTEAAKFESADFSICYIGEVQLEIPEPGTLQYTSTMYLTVQLCGECNGRNNSYNPAD